jgi:hypothetical protein
MQTRASSLFWAGNVYTTTLEIAAPDLIAAQRAIQAAMAGVKEPPAVTGASPIAVCFTSLQAGAARVKPVHLTNRTTIQT